MTEFRVVGVLALALGLASLFAPYRWHEIPLSVANSGLAAAVSLGLWAGWIALPDTAKNWFTSRRSKLLTVFALTVIVAIGTVLVEQTAREKGTDLETAIMLLAKAHDLKQHCDTITAPFNAIPLHIVTDGSAESRNFVDTFASLLPAHAVTVWEPLRDEQISRGIELRVREPLNPSLEAVKLIECFHNTNLPLPIHELHGEERLRASVELFVGLQGQASIMRPSKP
jgi:hypothetical protein